MSYGTLPRTMSWQGYVKFSSVEPPDDKTSPDGSLKSYPLKNLCMMHPLTVMPVRGTNGILKDSYVDDKSVQSYSTACMCVQPPRAMYRRTHSYK